MAILADNPTLCDDLQMRKVPHFTTLQKVERKLLNDQHAHTMLTQTVGLFFDLPQASVGDRRVV